MNKEIWKMTRGEHMQRRMKGALSEGKTVSPAVCNDEHESAVRGALAGGFAVPSRVLDEYPGLKSLAAQAARVSTTAAKQRAGAVLAQMTPGGSQDFSAAQSREHEAAAIVAAAISNI